MIGHEIAVDFPVYWAGAYRLGEAEWENLRQLCIGFILEKEKSLIKVFSLLIFSNFAKEEFSPPNKNQ